MVPVPARIPSRKEAYYMDKPLISHHSSMKMAVFMDERIGAEGCATTGDSLDPAFAIL